MPSKNMLPKGKRRHTVKHLYRATRGVEVEPELEIPQIVLDGEAETVSVDDGSVQLATVTESEDGGVRQRSFTAAPAAAGLRLDQYLAKALPEISRARVQLLVEHKQIALDGKPAKASAKLRGGEQIVITGSPQPVPLKAVPEDIPLDVIFEDKYLAVVNKAAGMMVHAGAGLPQHDSDTPDPRTTGTLVNALLFRFATLSESGGPLRPGIVHRLDKQTSGLIAVAKDDETHRKLAEKFQNRSIEKKYLALAHGHLKEDDTTVDLAIGRDPTRRNRMTAKRQGDDHDYWSVSGPGEVTDEDEEFKEMFEAKLAKQRQAQNAARSARSHVHVVERLNTPYGPFTLVEVRIETGRTHQIRVHLQALGHPVVGDTLYGAPGTLLSKQARKVASKGAAKKGAKAEVEVGETLPELSLGRNFLHAAFLSFEHPRLKKTLKLEAPLPKELAALLETLRNA